MTVILGISYIRKQKFLGEYKCAFNSDLGKKKK